MGRSHFGYPGPPQNHLSQVQSFFLGMLSTAGRTHVAGVVRQRRHLYGPGVTPLKDIVGNYTALTGSHKALLASVQLIVFRGVLSSAAAMVRERRRTKPLFKEYRSSSRPHIDVGRSCSRTGSSDLPNHAHLSTSCVPLYGSQVRLLKPTSLAQMRNDVWGNLTDDEVLSRLKEYLQASSALSFAARAQEYTDSDLGELHLRAGDYVSTHVLK